MRSVSGIIILLITISFKSPCQTTDFFKVPKDAKVSYSHGALQGTHHSKDSTGFLGQTDVYNDKDTYELLFLYKDVATRKEMGYDALSKIFFDKELGKDNYADFDCYAFVFPQHDPEQQEDAHALTIDFPVTVAAYKRTAKRTWEYVAKTKANTFEAFSEFQFKIIYNLVPGK